MSTITPFPADRIVGSRLHPRKPRRKRGELWRLADLEGRRPRGHVAPEFTPKGKVILAVGQVWVLGHSQELVVITQIDRNCAAHPAYPDGVWITPYLRTNSYHPHFLREMTFRQTHRVWDQFAPDMAETMRKLERIGGEGARSFFGLNVHGERID